MSLQEEIRKLIKAHPFDPFEIELVTGRVLEVNHHDFALLPPVPRAPHLVWYDAEGHAEIINVALVVAVRKRRGSRKTRRRKAG